MRDFEPRAAFPVMNHAKAIRALLIEGARSQLGARLLLNQHAAVIELVQADDLAVVSKEVVQAGGWGEGVDAGMGAVVVVVVQPGVDGVSALA